MVIRAPARRSRSLMSESFRHITKRHCFGMPVDGMLMGGMFAVIFSVITPPGWTRIENTNGIKSTQCEHSNSRKLEDHDLSTS